MNSVELLLVEDLDDRREKYRKVASELGIQSILEASSVSQAHEHIVTNLITVAVVDLGLPSELEGLELIRFLHQAQPRCHIIAITGQPHADAKGYGIKAMKMGADDYINSKWIDINFYELLSHRLRLWRGVDESVPA